jgi:O-acetylhomoserine/O-acetylserine sulfhydrylase-like pyridoxal-dependent enzyme
VKGTPKLEVDTKVMLLIYELILGTKTLEEAKEELPNDITNNKQNRENAEYILTEVARALEKYPLPEGTSYSTWPNPQVEAVEKRIAAVDLVLNRITGKTYDRLRLI